MRFVRSTGRLALAVVLGAVLLCVAAVGGRSQVGVAAGGATTVLAERADAGAKGGGTFSVASYLGEISPTLRTNACTSVYTVTNLWTEPAEIVQSFRSLSDVEVHRLTDTVGVGGRAVHDLAEIDALGTAFHGYVWAESGLPFAFDLASCPGRWSQYYLAIVQKRWPPIPEAPVLTSDLGVGRYTLRWNGVDLAESYLLQEAVDPDFADVAQSWELTPTTAYTVTDLSAGPYYYRVRARGRWADSSWSHSEGVLRDDFATPASGWAVANNDYERWRYVNGRYEGTAKQPDVPVFERAPVRVDDFTLQTDFYPITRGSEGTHGLVFGLSVDGREYYAFGATPFGGGQYLLERRMPGGQWVTLQDWAPHAVDATHFRLKVVRSGDRIELFIDDQWVAGVTDDVLTGARGVGVYVVPFVEPVASGSVTTQFDNFVVAGPVVGFDAP